MTVKEMLELAEMTVSYNVDELNISKRPSVEVVRPSEMRTKTTLAALSPDLKHLAVNRSISDEKTIVFAVSHEMRHAWQMEHGLDMSDYVPSDQIENAEYNRQRAEIDAHAWACLVVMTVYGMKPVLNSLDAETISAIEKRIREICE